jgi:hypothetical protein
LAGLFLSVAEYQREGHYLTVRILSSIFPLSYLLMIV